MYSSLNPPRRFLLLVPDALSLFLRKLILFLKPSVRGLRHLVHELRRRVHARPRSVLGLPRSVLGPPRSADPQFLLRALFSVSPPILPHHLLRLRSGSFHFSIQ